MQCEQAGRDMAVQVKRRLKAKERGATATSAVLAASGPQLAMGRVIGSLCVVTARDEDATNAMLVGGWGGAAVAAPLRACVCLRVPCVCFWVCFRARARVRVHSFLYKATRARSRVPPPTASTHRPPLFFQSQPPSGPPPGVVGVPGVVRAARPDGCCEEGPRPGDHAHARQAVCDVHAG